MISFDTWEKEAFQQWKIGLGSGHHALHKLEETDWARNGNGIFILQSLCGCCWRDHQSLLGDGMHAIFGGTGVSFVCLWWLASRIVELSTVTVSNLKEHDKLFSNKGWHSFAFGESKQMWWLCYCWTEVRCKGSLLLQLNLLVPLRSARTSPRSNGCTQMEQRSSWSREISINEKEQQATQRGILGLTSVLLQWGSYNLLRGTKSSGKQVIFLSCHIIWKRRWLYQSSFSLITLHWNWYFCNGCRSY